MMRRSAALLALVPSLALAASMPRMVAVVAESEPNDQAALATPFAPGDTLNGSVTTDADVDFYRVDLAADEVLEIQLSYDSAVDRSGPIVSFHDSDRTELVRYNFAYGLRITAQQAGAHYIRVAGQPALDDGDLTYRLETISRAHGSGDPTLVTDVAGWDQRTSGILSGVVAGPAGGVVFADLLNLWIANADGTDLRLLSAFGRQTRDLAVDGFGDILASTFAYEQDGDGNTLVQRIMRIETDGDTSTVATGPGSGGSIGVGPDGDIWAIQDGVQLQRFDPFGNPRSEYRIPSGAVIVGFAPDSSVILRQELRLFRWTEATGAVQVFENGDVIVDGVVDSRGNTYLHLRRGGIVLLDASFQTVETPFAITNVPSFESELFFLRAPDGSASSDLRLAVRAQSNLGHYPTGTYTLGFPEGAVAAPGTVPARLIRAERGPIPGAVVGGAYSFQLTAEGGSGTWSVYHGALPPGLELSPDGVIHGMPVDSGEYVFTARIDRDGRWGGSIRSITVRDPAVRVLSAADHLMLPGALDSVQERFLDIRGNVDGRYDLADFHRLALEAGLILDAPTDPVPSDGEAE